MGSLNLGGAAVVENQAGAIFDVQTDGDFVLASGVPSVLNAGVFRKSSGPPTPINVAFTNTGTLDIGAIWRYLASLADP